VSFDPGILDESLASLAAGQPEPARYVVALSGGVDSAALLTALAQLDPGPAILALHVDHGLHADSAAWERRAQALAASLAVPYQGVRVDVDPADSRGLEAAAREARYDVFRSRIAAGDWLLMAHHRDDQAETLMLNLLRGSGLLGLAAMPARRSFGDGLLVRPLLGVGRADLVAWAGQQGIDWVEDPSNSDLRLDRNFLRHRIMPSLRQRWDAAPASMARSAALLAEAQQLLDDLASLDLAGLRGTSDRRLSLEGLRSLSGERQRNVLRFACRRLGLPLPPAGRLEAVCRDVLGAREDAGPLVAWPGAELRRFRNELFLLRPSAGPEAPTALLGPEGGVDLGKDGGRLELRCVDSAGIAPSLVRQGLTVGYRKGGERLRPGPGAPRRTLKSLLQSSAVLPWMRNRIPLLRSSERLVAAGDLWVDADCLQTPGYRVHWIDRPELY